MGHGLDTPLLAGGPPNVPQQQQPSAPPLVYATLAGGYPPISVSGAPQQQPPPPPPRLLPYAPAQQQQQQQQQPAVGVPFQQQHQAGSGYPVLQPPAVHVVQQHTYLHVPSDGEPLLTRSSCAAPRPMTCPACFSSGPTRVTRESGCCAWLACFGLCWVCCPLFWLPFCLDCSQDVVHRCRACGSEVSRNAPCA